MAQFSNSQNKPMVINYSAGGDSGPHDGTMQYETMLDSLNEYQVPLVVSAETMVLGKKHTNFSFTPSNNLMQTFVTYNNKSDLNNQNGWDIWGSANTNFTVDGCMILMKMSLYLHHLGFLLILIMEFMLMVNLIRLFMTMTFF